MKHKEIAEYFGLSPETVRRWSPEKRRKAIVIMQSGAEPQIIKLIGDISQLCYIFDCKHVVGTIQVKCAKFLVTSSAAQLAIYGERDSRTAFGLPEIDLNASTAVAELQKVKQTLESFIY